MADTEHGDQELHLPHGSWAPLWLAIAIFLALLGIVLGGGLLYLGLAAVALAGLVWIYEDVDWYHDHIGTGSDVGRWGILLFIGSEVMIFGALFATYFNFKAQAPVWPPEGMPELPIVSTSIFTIILFLSGATMHWAHDALRKGKMRLYRGHLILTIVLGTIFMAGQVMEYSHLIHEGMTLQSHPYGSTFYLLTGTHGFHVLVGLIFLGVVAYRTFAYDQMTPKRHVALEAAALYWHFVDLVWVFVFAVIYLGWA